MIGSWLKTGNSHQFGNVIGVTGPIGVGKTTFTEVVAKRFGFDEIYESVIDNPYLEDFYNYVLIFLVQE